MSDLAAGLYAELFGDAEVTAHLSSAASVQALLDVERALAEAEEEIGIIPPGSAGLIAAAAAARHYDLPTLAREAAAAGNVAIPLVAMLRAKVAEADAAAATWVHFGATSQDIVDTAVVLQLGATVPLVARRLDEIAAAARRLAEQHAGTVMPGRTWMRQATPVTFGLTAAKWADAVARVSAGVRLALENATVVQLGGATGTLAAFGGRGQQLVGAFADRLRLGVPDVPWHSHRDRLVSLASALGVACGTIAKIARDISLLSQTEIGELRLERSTGGSSTMPHKRNPVGCAVALAAGLRVPGLVATLLASMPQELERGLGGWPAEWEPLSEIVSLTAGASRAMAATVSNVTVDEARMAANLQRTGGAVMSEAVALALTPQLGRERAQAALTRAAARSDSQSRPLLDILLEDPEVRAVADRATLERLLEPREYLGEARELIARVIYRAERAGG